LKNIHHFLSKKSTHGEESVIVSVKIIHAADLHLDSVFAALSPEQATERRRDQRNILHALAKLEKTEAADIILLSGDIFDRISTYSETDQAMLEAFGKMKAEIFIAPGNHDYYCARSPYALLPLPENVHVFKSESISSFTLPRLNCRVWGAGFMADKCRNLLEGFSVGKSDMTEIMVLHADLSGGEYNPITSEQIEKSGLDYLALGHIHTYSGIKHAGSTCYAYPGCPEGRGFDETGVKGFIAGTVEKHDCALRFVPIAGHRYDVFTVSVTGKDPATAALEAAGVVEKGDCCRMKLTGECEKPVDIKAVIASLNQIYANVQVEDGTFVLPDVWEGAGEDNLRGVFLDKLRGKYDKADANGKAQAILAAKFAVAAMDNYDVPEMSGE
jgi:DNA repair exonuclease SbcCD nuclease subunit